MIKKLAFYTKIGLQLVKKEVVTNSDYRNAYDEVSKTYPLWLEKMGKFTDHLIFSENIPTNGPLKVLDFACGTGYITKNLITNSAEYEITAVDQSPKMLENLTLLDNVPLKIICSDGIEFLKTTTETFDIIFFGWALSYFNHHEVLALFHKVLNANGTLAIITNINGTLDKMERIFLKVMSEHPNEVMKPMPIKQNLPLGKKGLTKWCQDYKFKALETYEGESICTFNTSEELLDWLNLTGACAGTQMIFKDYNVIKPALIENIEKEKFKNNTYEINHKFAYGIFIKEEGAK